MKPSATNPTVWVGPSFFDVQINGGIGIDFGTPGLTAADVRTVAARCRAHGIGAFCPTVITGPAEAVRRAFAGLAAARDADPFLSRAIPGYHLEGPYISGDDGPRGAHPRAHVRDPDWDEFRRWQDAADGRIVMVTLAPERPGALPFVEKLAAAGVVPAIGHTAAGPGQIRDAVSAGARASTHLGNGCHAALPRHENHLWEQLCADELWASIIPDGHHLPASLVKAIVRCKSPARTIVTCDASSLAGLPPGRYRQWESELEVLPGGKVVVPGTPYLAGSGRFTDWCVGTVVQQAGVSLAEAVAMASVRPRQLLGLPVPALAAGSSADLVTFTWEPGGEVRVLDVIG